eukprot:CAMPEP_0203661314 /NCGR_PEP_ID=MMETSP0088-20131115/59546_1 /ASSEMBLY_ACC=CAM_ASM_001087 /TAXON_ID=426623 /ORGANISM="Chaetoceros affinis, Strain CCMP159" /LENGTH=264 /DNA_ID=CAMNT_0050523977 /DNA_START=91 /DNA_END=885 /DNA_ORIENTATION=-
MDRDGGKIEEIFAAATSMSVRQTRRGCCQELLGCEAADEFKWFNTTDGRNDEFGVSLEDSPCFTRMCCGGCHEFTMVAKENGSGEEILTMYRPWACNAGACKCCCYQKMEYSYKGSPLGQIEELCWVCVPRMQITDASGSPVYKVHPPTCVGGMCVDICAEGNPCCGKGCCKVPFYIYPATQEDTDNGAPYVGKVVKVPKSLTVEFLTDAEAYDIVFPMDATSAQKAMIAGGAVFINANFFEQESQGSGGGDCACDCLLDGLLQ